MSDDYREKFSKQIINQEIKGLEHADTFEFSCRMCGECCHNREDILLSSYDVFRLSQYLKLQPLEFVGKYCDKYIGRDSKLPIISLLFKKRESLGQEYTACPFLKHRDGFLRCTVHQGKPFVCAAYPLGRACQEKDGVRKVLYYKQDVSCGKSGVTQTVQEWLDSYGLNDSEEAFVAFSNFIVDLYDIIDLKKFNEDKSVSKEMINDFYLMLTYLLYWNYDIEKPFIPQYKINIEEIIEKTKEYVTILSTIGIRVVGQNYKIEPARATSIMEKLES